MFESGHCFRKCNWYILIQNFLECMLVDLRLLHGLKSWCIWNILMVMFRLMASYDLINSNDTRSTSFTVFITIPPHFGSFTTSCLILSVGSYYNHRFSIICRAKKRKWIWIKKTLMLVQSSEIYTYQN